MIPLASWWPAMVTCPRSWPRWPTTVRSSKRETRTPWPQWVMFVPGKTGGQERAGQVGEGGTIQYLPGEERVEAPREVSRRS